MRSVLKQFANLLAIVAAMPLALSYRVVTIVLDRQSCFAALAQCVSLLPGKCGIYFRRGLYRQMLRVCGSDAQVGFAVLLTSPETSLGARCYIGPFSILGEVTIEDDVLIASHVSIINGARQHGVERCDVSIREQEGAMPLVTIGEGSWIGEQAVVMADVGRHCIVGAGAVVTKPIPDFAVAMGVPARVMRFREPTKPSTETTNELATAGTA
jgi:virginiamycin A acetyltransferase